MEHPLQGGGLRPEEAGRGIGQHLPFLTGDVEAEDVGDAGIIAGTEQRCAVRRESEALRRRGWKVEPRDRYRRTGEQALGTPDAHRLVAVNLTEAGRLNTSVIA